MIPHERSQAQLIALAADLLLGELPNVIRLVVWIGCWMRLSERLAPAGPRGRPTRGALWLIGRLAGC